MTHLRKTDPAIYQLIKDEEKRQKDVLEMIPSENYTSSAVMEALGSVLTNKYSEGFPKKRYYQGNIRHEKTFRFIGNRCEFLKINCP